MPGHCHKEGCDHGHDSSPELGIEYSLYTKIDKENVQCLNETIEGSGKEVFRAWDERHCAEKFVESDADEELLFNIPFTGNVKLKGVIVMGEQGETHPDRMRLFKNRPGMTFEETGAEADQEFELNRDTDGRLEYATRIVKFSSVTHLTIHFPSNFGSDNTVVRWIGLKGEWQEAHRHGVTICNYELMPQIDKLKNKGGYEVNRQVQ